MAKVLVLGARGMLGREVVASATLRGHVVSAPSRQEVDLSDGEGLRARLATAAPDVVVNCAAFTDVDRCQEAAREAFEINGHAVGRLALAVEEECDGVLIQVSTDYVFDGQGRTPYREDDPTDPQSVYGQSKLLGEQLLRGRRAITVRTSWLFGCFGKNFVGTIAGLSRQGSELRVVNDQKGAPTYAPFLAEALLDIADQWLSGNNPPSLLHYRNREPATWYELALEVAERWPPNAATSTTIIPVTTAEFRRPAPRPAYSVLSVELFESMTRRRVEPWLEGLDDYRRREQAASADSAP